ncbi:hypothetical protein [Ichthyobacterium seriolicida]|uniref:Lipoprotein n=1 Tax=Ichthyobacterium seriolicida TaxID=242600 RepID=A0A1J1E9Z0_9FLAO|nr:hypothetical protein [Ichthyobacterium seriolicida]BAV94739.1 hypothetical protein JBKA6_0726 [Ichthyobacterium seriolicida]
MKTNKIFKNLLSLLTIGLVVFSCNKPAETPKTGEDKTDVSPKALELVVTSLKFEKAKNLKDNNVSEFYEKLFITKTPARAKGKDVAADASNNGYPTEFTTVPADIVGDSIINIKLPYNSQFIDLTDKATATATITFKSAVDSINLEVPKITNIKGNSVEISFEINKDHFTLEKLKSANPVIKQVLKFSKTGFTDKVYTVNFKFSQTKSTDSALTVSDANKVTGLGFTKKSSGFNDKIEGTADTTVHNPTKTSTGNGTKESPYALTMTKGTELDNSYVINSTAASFKADALTLPDGAYIDVTDLKSGITHHVAKKPTEQFEIKDNNSSGIQFRVVAQDGKTATHYKLTFTAS